MIHAWIILTGLNMHSAYLVHNHTFFVSNKATYTEIDFMKFAEGIEKCHSMGGSPLKLPSTEWYMQYLKGNLRLKLFRETMVLVFYKL